jgi:hypothetical protein
MNQSELRGTLTAVAWVSAMITAAIVVAVIIVSCVSGIDRAVVRADEARDLEARRERACVAVVECRAWLASCLAHNPRPARCAEHAARLGFVPGVRP